MSGEQIKQAVQKVIIGNADPTTAFFGRAIFSSEFLLLLLFCFGIYANFAFFEGRVPDKAIDLIGIYVGAWTGLRQVGKLSAANPSGNKINGSS